MHLVQKFKDVKCTCYITQQKAKKINYLTSSPSFNVKNEAFITPCDTEVNTLLFFSKREEN